MLGLRSSLVAGGAVLAALCALLLYRTRSPYLFLFLVGVLLAAAAAAAFAARRRTVAARAALVVAGLALGALAIEGSAIAIVSLRPDGESPRRLVGSGYDAVSYFVPDPDLGHAPAPGAIARVQRLRGARRLYDVTYHVDEHGLRVSRDPTAAVAEGARNVLFFGCSFAFGEALADEESLPYRFGVLSDGAFVPYNLAFHGYGPHQMLSILETGRERRAIDAGRPTPYGIYVALLPAHVDRVVGKAVWDPGGPRYVLDPASAGGIARDGVFHGRAMRLALSLLGKSVFHREILLPQLAPPLDAARAPDAEELFVRVVRRAQDLFEERYGGRFLVVLWPEHGAPTESYARRLAEVGVPTVGVADLVPGYAPPPSPYHVPEDSHPSALADDEVARALLRYLRSWDDSGVTRTTPPAPPRPAP
jgi:hypothetical protein